MLPGKKIVDGENRYMQFENIKIMVTGGGTGGHIFPALAAIEFLKEKGIENFMYIGGTKGLENEIIPKTGIPFRQIWISGIERGSILKNILFPLKLTVATLQSMIHIVRYNPDIVLGFGGYVSGPVIFTASSLLYPTLIMEQDVYPGITSRLLSRWAKKILVAFEESIQYFSPKQRYKIQVSGNPIRPSIQKLDKKEARRHLGMNEDVFTLVIMGGSQGARAINEAILNNLDEILRLPIQIIWQTGTKNYEAVKDKVKSRDNILIQPFFDEMKYVYSAADLIVNRAGALTLAEILKMKIPSILVPYPFAAGDHQRKNAAAMEKRGIAKVVDQDEEQFEEKLISAITNLVNNPDELTRMKTNLNVSKENKALEVLYENMIELIAKKI